MVNSFGEFLKQKRQEKQLTQKMLSEQLFVSESAVSKWEKDVAHPDITLLPKLAEILGVTEHELITASIDKQAREEKVQAKKWRALSISWSLFFYIAYGITLIPCFICNLAINHTLSWFWIVVASLLLAFTFTNLPKIVKKHKLLVLPLSMYMALCILLGVCSIYTQGAWFWVVVVAVLLGLAIIFVPIYIAKYKIFKRIKNFRDFISIAVDFLLINILLIIVESYSINNYASGRWYINIALPIVVVVYIVLNIYLSVRFLKINKLLKTSLILFFTNLLYLIPMIATVDNIIIQREITEWNIFKANFANWQPEICLTNNIHLIIFLVVFALAITFLVTGLFRHFKRKNNI